MTNDLTATPTAPPKGGKGALITGAVLLVLGILATVLGVAVVGNCVEGDHRHPGRRLADRPDHDHHPLDAATTYAVYEAADAGKGTVQAADVTVTNAAGDPVTVTKTTDSVSATGKDGKNYVEVANFTIGTSDTFTITVATQGAVVAVAPSLSTASKGTAFFAAIILGILLGIVGIILLIVGAVRRSSSR